MIKIIAVYKNYILFKRLELNDDISSRYQALDCGPGFEIERGGVKLYAGSPNLGCFFKGEIVKVEVSDLVQKAELRDGIKVKVVERSVSDLALIKVEIYINSKLCAFFEYNKKWIYLVQEYFITVNEADFIEEVLFAFNLFFNNKHSYVGT